MSKYHCPYCGKQAWRHFLQTGETYTIAENGQVYHKSCKLRSEVKEDMAMFKRVRLGPGGVREVKG